MIIIQRLSKTPRAKWKVLKNEKCKWSSRDCNGSNFDHTNYLLNVSLKRKADKISIIKRRMTTEKRARAVGIPRQGTGIRQVSHFFFSTMFSNPGLLLTNVAVYDKPNYSSVISDAGIQRSETYADGQRKQYVLL